MTTFGESVGEQVVEITKFEIDDCVEEGVCCRVLLTGGLGLS